MEEKEVRKKTILIFGVSSFVGSSLAEFLKGDFRVVGTYHKNKIDISGVLAIPCDVMSKEEVQLAIYAFKPDLTIYAVGLSSVMKCANNDDVADALNTAGLINVTEYSQRYKCQVCYISSSYVFYGEDKKYIEMDIPDSNTMYGKTQAASEFYIQKSSLNYIIFRCCNLYGRSLNPNRKTTFESIQEHLSRAKSMTLDSVVMNGFLDVYYLGMIIKISLEKQVKNRLFQVSSKDFMSVYDFSKKYCEVFGENATLISKGKLPFPELTITDSAFHYKMDTTNLEGYLHLEMPTIEESLRFSFARFNGKEVKDIKGTGVKYI